jgi:chromate transporter
VLPSLALLIVLSWGYLAWGDVPLVAGVFAGIKPAVVALVAVAAWRIGRRTLKNAALVAIAGAAFAGLALGLPFPLILLAAALAGLAGGQWAPQHFEPGGGGHAAGGSAGAAVIDDDTPPPPHTRFSRARLAWVLAVGIGLGAAGLAVLALHFGWQGTLTQMGWFFTQAALLTFGGAYAVLPFVHEGAVVQQGWLSSAQMLDGLALGETTPGPLIMVVAFVGFVGGWTKAVFGPDALALAGVAGALVATAFTFLPSFVFILAGGPVIESSRQRPRLTAPLTAITAAVVGVIAHLAVFLAAHAIWPAGLDAVALGLALAAAVALLRFGLGPVVVVLGAGAFGALRTALV